MAASKFFPNIDKFLVHCHRRKYPAKSTIIYAGDESDDDRALLRRFVDAGADAVIGLHGHVVGDMELYLEFMLAKGSNSGIYLHSLYEVQVFDSFGKITSQFYGNRIVQLSAYFRF